MNTKNVAVCCTLSPDVFFTVSVVGGDKMYQRTALLPSSGENRDCVTPKP
jgi:hypothetical protein